jgi:IS5 family transposase
MREGFRMQLPIGYTNISEVELKVTSRRELTAILRALQHIYSRPDICHRILSLIEADIVNGQDVRNGRQGLRYWEALVLASVRLGTNLDYDALEDLAKDHRRLREIMGLSFIEETKFSRSRLQENLSKLSPETIREISKLVFQLGDELEPEAVERVRTVSLLERISNFLLMLTLFGMEFRESFHSWRT